MNDSIAAVLMERDGYSESDARQAVQDARERVRDGEDPEEILYEEFGLEPDYVLDLLIGWELTL